MKYAIKNLRCGQFVRNDFTSQTGGHLTTSKSFYKRSDRKLVEKHLAKAEQFLKGPRFELQIVEVEG